MKSTVRTLALLLVLTMTFTLSSCFHDNWDIPEREDPEFDLGELFGAMLPNVGGENLANGLELSLSEDGSYYIVEGVTDRTAEKIEIPASYKNLPVKRIEDNAFEGLETLREIVIPLSVTSVGKNAFGGCSSLSYNSYEGGRYLGNELNPYLVLVRGGTDSIASAKIHADTRVIAPAAYQNNKSIKSIVIPDGVVTVGDSAFYGCSNVHTVSIGNGVETIEDKAFFLLGKLTKLDLGESVKRTGEYAFYSATSLAELVIPDSVTEIEMSAFASCSSLETVKLGEGLRTLGMFAFSECVKLADITFGSALERIESKAFNECLSLKNVSLPHSIEYIDTDSFDECSDEIYNIYGMGYYLGSEENPYEYLMDIPGAAAGEIETLELHGDTRRVALRLFRKYDVKNLVINNPTYLKAQKNCLIDVNERKIISGTKSATLPTDGSVVSIAEYAFYGVESLKISYIPTSIESIGAHAFEKCKALYSIMVGGRTVIGEYAFADCTAMTAVNFKTKTLSIGDYAFSNCSSISTLTIPDSVTYLGKGSFSGCIGLKEVNIGSGVSAIGDAAFSSCRALTIVKCSDNIKRIGSWAFNGCVGMTYFDFKTGLESIGDCAFSQCKSLLTGTLPDSVAEIGAYAFAGCSALKWMNLGLGLRKIGDGAWTQCKASLDVRYRGTVEMWKKIKIGENLLSYNPKVICTDGEVALESD